MKKLFPVSDDFIDWAESLSALLTSINVDHGGPAEMIEHEGWDQSRTPYAMKLIQGLSKHLQEIEREMDGHISNRPQ